LKFFADPRWKRSRRDVFINCFSFRVEAFSYGDLSLDLIASVIFSLNVFENLDDVE